MSTPHPSSIHFAFITGLLSRTPAIHDVAALTHLRPSQVAATMTAKSFWSDQDLITWAKSAPENADLAFDFTMVAHDGAEMQGLEYQYCGGTSVTAFSHRFASFALVKPGHDPVPLGLNYAVSKTLQTEAYTYFTASQWLIAILDLMQKAGVCFRGVLVDAEFTTNEVIDYCMTHQIKILGRIKSNRKVEYNGKFVKLSELAELFPPRKCHYTSKFNWRSKRVHVILNGEKAEILIIYRKQDGVWKAFFLVSTFPPEEMTLAEFLRAWKARWGIEVIHRLVKQNLSFGKCKYRHIMAHRNWAFLVVEAFHAVLEVRKRNPGLTWRAAQLQAALEHREAVRTVLLPSCSLVEAV